jgi:hypothetical protein
MIKTKPSSIRKRASKHCQHWASMFKCRRRPLFHRCHRLAASAVARALAYGVAVAVWTAGTCVLSGGGKGLFLAVDIKNYCPFLHLHHLGFDQVLSAGTLSWISGNGTTGAAVAAAAGVHLIARSQHYGAVFQGGIYYKREKNCGNHGQKGNSDVFFHSCSPFSLGESKL